MSASRTASNASSHRPRRRNGTVSIRSRMTRVSGCPISAYRPNSAGLLSGPYARSNSSSACGAAPRAPPGARCTPHVPRGAGCPARRPGTHRPASAAFPERPGPTGSVPPPSGRPSPRAPEPEPGGSAPPSSAIRSHSYSRVRPLTSTRTLSRIPALLRAAIMSVLSSAPSVFTWGLPDRCGSLRVRWASQSGSRTGTGARVLNAGVRMMRRLVRGAVTRWTRTTTAWWAAPRARPPVKRVWSAAQSPAGCQGRGRPSRSRP